MLFSITTERTCVFLESVNLISNMGFLEVRGQTRQIQTFQALLAVFRRFGGSIGGKNIIFHS